MLTDALWGCLQYEPIQASVSQQTYVGNILASLTAIRCYIQLSLVNFIKRWQMIQSSQT